MDGAGIAGTPHQVDAVEGRALNPRAARFRCASPVEDAVVPQRSLNGG
jgi:hypothetical protein